MFTPITTLPLGAPLLTRDGHMTDTKSASSHHLHHHSAVFSGVVPRQLFSDGVDRITLCWTIWREPFVSNDVGLNITHCRVCRQTQNESVGRPDHNAESDLRVGSLRLV